MRVRTAFLILAAAAVVALALLNWGEVKRLSTLNLVWTQLALPLPLVLLGLLGLAIVVSLASGATQRARHHQREQELAQSVQTQRDLADRAEASRFVDLRQALDSHLRESRQRESGISASVDQALMRHQRETRTQLEGLHRAMGSRLGEMEARLEARLDGIAPPRGEWPSNGPALAATRETGHPATWAEPVESPEGREGQAGGEPLASTRR